MSTRSTQRRILFYVIAVAIPVITLLAIEGILRIAGYGRSVPTFVQAPHEGYIMPNPDLVFRFVPPGVTPPTVSPDTYYIRAQKPADTVRIVVMGGSTAAGFPYGRFGSPAGILQQRLIDLYPQMNTKVVSVAMSAVNSYALRDIASDVAELSPDAVLIYAGHNEYLGIMGADSAFSGPASHVTKLTYLALKDSRLVQLLSYLLNHDEEGPDGSQAGRTVMAQMAEHSRIPLDSAMFVNGENQLRSNIDAVLEVFESRTIPVFLSAIVSNEKDQAPFASDPAEGIPSLSTFLNHRMAISAKVRLAEKAVSKTQNSADAHFALARILYPDKPALAATHFQTARDLDLLRFRAPASFNEILKTLAGQRGAHWVLAVREGRCGRPFRAALCD